MRRIDEFKAAGGHLICSAMVKFSAIVMSLTILSAWPAAAQVNAEAFREYFLVGQFGEVCTMCEVVVLCEAADAPPTYEAVPNRGTFTLYHLETRSFWSQVSTIWEFFVSNFTTDSLAKRGHGRPVNVYKIEAGNWASAETIEGRLILDPGILEFGPANIDRVNREWLDASTGNGLGFCQRLPLWDSLDTIAANSSHSE